MSTDKCVLFSDGGGETTPTVDVAISEYVVSRISQLHHTKIEVAEIEIKLSTTKHFSFENMTHLATQSRRK